MQVSGDTRRRTYRLTPRPLTDAMGWMVDVGAEWDERLDVAPAARRARDLIPRDAWNTARGGRLSVME